MVDRSQTEGRTKLVGERRAEQKQKWFTLALREKLMDTIMSVEHLQTAKSRLEDQVKSGELMVDSAAETFISMILESVTPKKDN